MHKSGRAREVQPTLLLLLLLPPPATGPLRLVGRDCAYAWCAADRQKAAVMQAVVRNPVVAHEARDAIARPIEQRVQLDKAILRIGGHKAHHRPLRRLFGAHASHPAGRPGERPPQRLDLAQGAATLPRRYRGAKPVDAVLGDPVLDGRARWQKGADALAVALLSFRPHRMGFREQPPGVEGDDVDCEVLGEDRVADCLIFKTEAGGENDAALDGAANRRQSLIKVEVGKGPVEPLRESRPLVGDTPARLIVHEANGTSGSSLE